METKKMTLETRCEIIKELLEGMSMLIESANKQSDQIACAHLRAALDKSKAASKE